MKPLLRRILTPAIAGAVGLSIALISAGQPASASIVEPQHHPEGAYLALGDSVPFGYNPLLPPGDAARYVGYPELAAPELDLSLANLSCPGQASGGFLDLTGADNGCFGFRANLPLHAAYTGSQLDAAVSFLTTHRNTRLVTLMLGANDLFLCQKQTADGCTSPNEVAATVKTYVQNLVAGLTAIRKVYHGRLVLVTYYTTNFSVPAQALPIQALNAAMTSVGPSFQATIADSYAAFARRTKAFGGDSCAAGLLIHLPSGGCDVHPSPRGARILAHVVTAAVEAQEPDHGGRRHA